MTTRAHHPSRGFSFVELLVTIAVIALVFGGLLGSIQFSLKLISEAKVSTSALALANERIEYIRSLGYSAVGTISGIPPGPIPQNSTSSLNGTTFHERVLIEYVDSPDDGVGGSDTNGILADYKRVKVEYSWQGISGTSSIFLLTNVVPPGIETTDGGGTLTVNVFDAGVLPVSGASVRLYNDTTTSTIDVTRLTNTSGIAMFSGAPAAANYQVTVTKADFSTDGTYAATTTNPNPATPPVAVLESAVSTMNFQIDELSDLTVRTIGTPTTNSFDDDFDDALTIGASTDVIVGGGTVTLGGGAGAYLPLGTVYATGTTPTTITAWDRFEWVGTIPGSTGLTVSLVSVSATGSYALVPDSDLPGNSAGFAVGPIDISGLSAVTYPSLALMATLTSTDVNASPELDSWSLLYTVSEPPIPNVPFTLRGNKVIGTDMSLQPIYKYIATHTTDGTGDVDIPNLEWDSYTLTLNTGAYDIKEACDALPLTLAPGTSETLRITLAPSTALSLRVMVVDTLQNPIIGATVDLTRSGVSESETTSTCGQVFMNSGLVNANDYVVAISAPGYSTETLTDYTIDGDETLTVTLVP